MKAALMALTIVLSFAKAQAAVCEASNLSQVMSCMQTYIQNQIFASDKAGLTDPDPDFQFAGRALQSTWNTRTEPEIHAVDMPKVASPTHCDYVAKDACGITKVNAVAGAW